jgi:hypothetical protein
MDRLSVPPSHSTFKPRVRIWVYADEAVAVLSLEVSLCGYPDEVVAVPSGRWGYTIMLIWFCSFKSRFRKYQMIQN